MTLKIKLPTAFTDTSLPKLQIDPVIPDAGALMLIDPAHPANPWAAGVPVDAALLPNLAEAQAIAVLGSSAASDIRPSMRRPAGFSGTAGLLERTGKGGVHGIVPQGGTGVAASGPVLAFPSKLTRYLLQNYNHVFYVGLWMKITRLPTNNVTGLYGLATGAQQTNSCLMYFGLGTNVIAGRPGQTPADAGYVEAIATSVYPPVLGNFWAAQESKDFYNRTANGVPTSPAPSAAASTTANSGIGWGRVVSTESIGVDGTLASKPVVSTTTDAGASFALYRMYVEDLTVSGRTVAAVKALDQAEYTKQVTAVGGRYYNDTFTNPSTIA